MSGLSVRLHSPGTSEDFLEIQNPSLEASHCMFQDRGDTYDSTGLFQTPTTSAPSLVTHSTQTLAEILSTAIHHHHYLQCLQRLALMMFPASAWPLRQHHHPAIGGNSAFPKQPNGFSPSKPLNLRKIPIHWVPSSPLSSSASHKLEVSRKHLAVLLLNEGRGAGYLRVQQFHFIHSVLSYFHDHASVPSAGAPALHSGL